MDTITDQALTDEVIIALRESGTPTIANILFNQGFKNTFMAGLSPLTKDQNHFAGPAYTLRFIPSREDLDSLENYTRDDNLHRRAVEECPAGSVLVIDAMDCLKASSAGDMMALRLKTRGVAAMVTNGGFRDSAGIIKSGLPAFQRRAALPPTPIALHPVALNKPVGCAGVAVYPNDIIVGDSEGVVVIPQHLAGEVARTAPAAAEYEEYVQLRVREGKSIFGLFPATQESLRDFQEWKAAGKRGRDKASS